MLQNHYLSIYPSDMLEFMKAFFEKRVTQRLSLVNIKHNRPNVPDSHGSDSEPSSLYWFTIHKINDSLH